MSAIRRRLLNASNSRLEVGNYQWVGVPRPRHDLRDKQCGNEKRMSRQFSHAHGAVLVETGYTEVFASDMLPESFIQAVVAGKDFGCFRSTVNAMCLAARDNPYSPFLPGNGAGQFADQFYSCIR